jgi:hypothetical protein
MKEIIFNLKLVGEEWSASVSGRIILGKEAPVATELEARWAFIKDLAGNQSHDFSIVQAVTQSLYKLYHCFPTRVPQNIFRDYARNFRINE